MLRHSLSPGLWLPTPDNVERPTKGSEPRVWIRQNQICRTYFDTDGLQKNTFARISVSPRVGTRKEHLS